MGNSSNIPVKYHGVVYKSKQALLRALGLKPHVLYGPNAKGKSVEEAVDFYLSTVKRVEFWSAEEDALIVEKYPICGADIPELLVKRNRHNIAVRASQLGVKFREVRVTNQWSPEDLAIVEAYYATKGATYCEQQLGGRFTKQDIYNRAHALGLISERKVELWSQEDIQILREKYPYLGVDIPELKHIDTMRIRNKAKRLGLVSRGSPDRGFLTYKSGVEGFTYVKCLVCSNVYILRSVDIQQFTHDKCSNGLVSKVPDGWHLPRYLQE